MVQFCLVERRPTAQLMYSGLLFGQLSYQRYLNPPGRGGGWKSWLASSLPVAHAAPPPVPAAKQSSGGEPPPSPEKIFGLLFPT